MLVTATLAVSWLMFSDQARYGKLIACFFGLLQETNACISGPSSLTFSAKSAILELEGGENKIFSFFKMFKKVIYFKYEKIYPVTGSL